ncbi:MAG TPA: hypothetical protein VEL74_02380 [Thermoanaerobaculia bacterium]|nr:hypothetical protein [Thermoanaerobaculia bacterium]
MSSGLTVEDVLGRLEKQLAFHQEQEAFHADQETHHRNQREHHAGQAESLARHIHAFREAAQPALDLASVPLPAAPSTPDLEALRDTGRRPPVQQIVMDVIQSLPPGEQFGRSKMMAEIERRHGQHLRQPMDPSRVSTALRRLAAYGWILLTRPGRPHQEALYVREA